MRGFHWVIFLFLAAVAVVGFSQTDSKKAASAPSASPAAAKTTDQVFKNIQSLKGVPADELIPAMQYFNAALGVQCNYCHVFPQGGNPQFDKDDKDEKRTAREMIAMTRAINKDNFKGSSEVGCATCHSGHSHPTSIPPMGEQAAEGNSPAQQPNAQPQQGNAGSQEKPQLPTVEQIADNFANAIGGKAAIQKVNTIVEKGTASTAQGPIQYEIDKKGPNSYLITGTLKNGSKIQQGTDGTIGWRGSQRGVEELTGIQLRALIANGRFDRNLLPAAAFSNARVVGTETIDGHECYVVRGALSTKGFSERQYFDRQSGLLLRRTIYEQTLFGLMPQTDDYSDYRDVQGVKVPFTVKSTQPNVVVTHTADSVEFNVPMDNSRFVRPAVGGAGGGK